MDYATVPIKVISSPTDWPTVYSAFAAAFFGAIAAFSLTLFLDRARERQRRLSEINAAIYGLLMSMATLVNIKEQRLTKFQKEFEELQELLIAMELFGSREDAIASTRIVADHLDGIGEQDSQLDGALIPWQDLTFPMTPDPRSLFFTTPGNADLVRLVHVAKAEMDGITGTIRDRNTFWRDNVDTTQGAENDNPHKKMIFIFQMLAFRKSVREHVDTALVVSQEALDQLEEYRKKHLKKRGWYSRWFFLIFIEKEAWTTYKQAPRITKAMPDKANYRSILDIAD